MKNKKTIIAVVVVIIAAVAAFLLMGGKQKQQVQYTEVAVANGDITSSVTATGTIEPVTSVTVGTQVSGIVSKIYVDYNSVVKKGQVIAELDRTNLLSELSTAQANLTSSQSSLTYETANYKRYKQLYDKGLVSANDYEQAYLKYKQALEDVQSKKNSVAKAQTNLGYATITSPIDGVVLSKEVEEGQTVAAAMTTPTLFKIAKDLTDMRVIADIDEADIGEVKEGQRVSFTVDAFPDDTFTGTVTQVRQQATTESNVVTYECVISAPNKDLKLKPGLTANATIFTNEVKNVLTIPAKALKFTPNDKLMAKDETIEDCQGTSKVWVREGKVFKAYPVKIGYTNGVLCEVVSGLKAGQKVLTDMEMGEAVAEDDSDDTSNPFMPGPPGKNKKK